MKPQARHVLNYLHDRGAITDLAATEHLAVRRLASRIHELRTAGYEITGERIAVTNRYGETVHVTEYRLAQQRVAQA